MMNLLGIILICLAFSASHVSSADSQHITKTEDVKLGFLGGQDQLIYSTVKTHNSTVMCMFDSFATKPRNDKEQSRGLFNITDINTTLCTHVVFRQVDIVNANGNFQLNTSQNDLYIKTVDLKKTNPKLKVIMSLGGWMEGTADFQAISSNKAALSQFTETVFEFLKEKKFDGLNVEWNWPGVSYTQGVPEDKKRFLDFIDSLSGKFVEKNLELAITLPAKIPEIEGGYDLPALNEKVDYFIVMGQDFAGNWGDKTGHHSPLCGNNNKMTVGAAVAFILSMIQPRKLIMGIPFAGKNFVLKEKGVMGNALGASSHKDIGFQGAFNKDNKVLNYQEVCNELKTHRSFWEVYYDEEAKVPFMRSVSSDHDIIWISFDDTKSVRSKVEFGNSLGIGGYAAWPVTTDDFKGEFCNDEPDIKIQYPLLRTINYVLSMNKTMAFSKESVESCLGHSIDMHGTHGRNSQSTTPSPTTISTTAKSPSPHVKKTSPEPKNEKPPTAGGNSAQYFLSGIPAVLFILCLMQL